MLKRFISRLPLTNIDLLILAVASLALVVVYFQIEPSPADYIMLMGAILMTGSLLIRRHKYPFSLLDIPLIGYVIWVASQAVLYHNHTDLRFAAITIYLAVSYFVISYAICLNPTRGLRWIWLAYLIGALFTAILLLYQLVDVYALGGDWNSLYFGRPNGWFKDANVAGPFLLPAIFYCLWWFYEQRRWRYLMTFVLLSTGLFCTFSRGAYLGYAGGVGLISCSFIWQFWGELRSRGFIKLLLVTGLSTIILWLGLSLYAPFRQLSMERFGKLIKTYDTEGRAVSWQASIKEFAQHPLGSGSGSYEQKSSDYQQGLAAKPNTIATDSATGRPISGQTITTKDGQQIILTPSAHNTYLRVLLENGVVGIVLLLLFWLWLLGKGILAVWRTRKIPDMGYLMIALVSFSVFLPMGTFIDTLHWRFLWVVAGILSATITLRNDRKAVNGSAQA